MAELARGLELTLAAVSHAVRRGEKTARKMGWHVEQSARTSLKAIHFLTSVARIWIQVFDIHEKELYFHENRPPWGDGHVQLANQGG